MANRLKVKLRGGLGNQLHIYIAAWVLGNRIFKGLVLDGRFISWTGSNPDRKMEIHKFELPKVLNFKNSYLGTLPSFKKSTVLRRGILKIIDLFASARRLKNIPSENWENLQDIEGYVRQNSKLEGHFLDLRWLVRAFDFGFPDHLALATNNSKNEITHTSGSNECAIHIRLTDFLDSKNNYVQLSEEYYLNALNIMQNAGYKQFVIYSDDVSRLYIEYPKLMKLENLQVTSSSLDAAESFYLMHKSAAIIAANSTFSTLAAMFIWKRGGDVIAPNERNLSTTVEKYWMPREWTILDFNSGLIH